ncbi:hypothetical protein [Marinibactrum halimedae]|uniref:Uncharacterized protein n=1 Tax=Marinibactrum halimedae TaxID=1444977 RepID=A0AA37TBT7_9GAMM|nr:hypothetical protein [Marinibactrum halimedae]MCD9459224.1 hypothetical protein [Marinibactrum halimedae]GLS27296.1 hypothetical protein GCM10007877_30150 [Marinibactrum halimedae]
MASPIKEWKWCPAVLALVLTICIPFKVLADSTILQLAQNEDLIVNAGETTPDEYSLDGTVLAFKPRGDAFDEVIKGIKEEVDGELRLVVVDANKSLDVQKIRKQMSQYRPNVVVLLGNRAVQTYTDYQKASGASASHPPAIATAALFVDQMLPKLKNTSAIRYEVPAVTSLVNVRNVVRSPVKTVGVLYRSRLKGVVDSYATYCKREGINLVGIELPNASDNMDKLIAKSLKDLSKRKVDSLLVLNDNVLLTSENVKKSWLPGLKKQKIPVVVGIEALVNTDLKFGSFSFSPDHYGLGSQTASIIWELWDNDWEFEDMDAQEPLSVVKTINTKVLSKNKIKVKENNLSSFDKVIKK